MFTKLTAFLVGLGSWSILLVAFIDSAGIPLTVGLDLLVVLLSAKEPEWAAWWVTLAVAGSSAGNLLLFQASMKGGRKLLKETPPEGNQRRFRAWFHQYGLVTVFIPALTPIPLPMKVFVVCAGMLGVRRITFLGVILLARTLRYGGEAYLGVQMGENSKAYLDSHWKQLTAGAALLTVALFLLVYWTGERRKRLAQKERGPADVT